jgi:hypothetical protein
MQCSREVQPQFAFCATCKPSLYPPVSPAQRKHQDAFLRRKILLRSWKKKP